MTITIGVIADDFTGATDIAGFLVASGLRTLQLNGEHLLGHGGRRAALPGVDPEINAVVISLKNRSNPSDEAIEKARAALAILADLGAEQVYFKYCSTFDSTPLGNIGPVTDALMDALDVPLTVVCPALPVNGRTTYQGYLFVGGVPLDESGMRHHPITPMTDASLTRLMEGQSRGRAGVVAVDVVERGVDEVRRALARLEEEGVQYAILDALTDEHLAILGEAVQDLPLVTGGSGLAGGIGRARTGAAAAGPPPFDIAPGRAVVLSGSSSETTNAQVARYRESAPHRSVVIDRILADPDGYLEEVLAWILAQDAAGPAPLVFATASPTQVQAVQERVGAERAGNAIEGLFARLAVRLVEEGVRSIIVAGGETSGAVTAALGINGFEVGPQIAPGVPLVRSLDGRIQLVLKSGNFGGPDFFADAQRR